VAGGEVIIKPLSMFQRWRIRLLDRFETLQFGRAKSFLER